MLKALFLDFDGLILDTELPDFQSWSEVYETHGQRLDLAVWAVAIGTRDAFDPYLHLEGLLGGAVDRESIRALRHTRNLEFVAAAVLQDGVEDLLAEAAALGLKTAVVSSSPTSWVEGHLERHALAGRFDLLQCFREGLTAKPDPQLYSEALSVLDLQPDEALAFEDSPNGVTAAKAAGIRCIAVPNFITSKLDLSHADLIVPSLAQVSLAKLRDAWP